MKVRDNIKKGIKHILVFTLTLSIFTGALAAAPIGNSKAEDINSMVPAYTVEYNEEKSSADIRFDLSTVKQDEFEVIKLDMPDRQYILYDKEKERSDLFIEVTENGKYEFIVTYIEKKSDEDRALEQKKSFYIDVSEIQSEETIDEDMGNREETYESKPVENGGEGIENLQTDFAGPMLFADSNSTINLAEAFHIYGDNTDSSGRHTITVEGNKAGLANADLRNEYPYQTSTLTSRRKLSFEKSWRLSADYSQSMVPDGVSIAFHNVEEYNGINLTGGYLGVYTDGTLGSGLSKGLVLELDAYSNKEYPGLGDEGYISGHAGAHLGVNQVTAGIADNLANGSSFLYSDLFDGTPGTLEIVWDVDTRTISLSYKSKTISYQFGSLDQLRSILGSSDLYAYYSITAAIHYAGGGPGSGNTEFVYNEFKYTEIEPELTDAEYFIVSPAGDETPLIPVDSSVVKSGDIILVRHKVKNNISVPKEFKDVFIAGQSISDGTTPGPISGSAKCYMDPGNKKPLSDHLFSTGVEITYPPYGAELYVEYQFKIPDYIDSALVLQLTANAWLGQVGMEQKFYSKEMDVISRGNLLINSSAMETGRFYQMDRSKEQFTFEEAKDLFYSDIKFQKQGHLPVSVVEWADTTLGLLYAVAYESSDNIMDTIALSRKTYIGGTDQGIAPINVKPDQMGMYYMVLQTYDKRFDFGYSGGIRNPNGLNTAVRYIWIGDGFHAQNGLYGLSERSEIDEVTLSRMSENELKKYLLNYIKVYSGSAVVDSKNNIQGDFIPHLETVNESDITVEGISSSSPANTYMVHINVTLDGKQVTVPKEVKVVAAKAPSYVVIPKNISLKSDKGINRTYAGEKAMVSLITSQQSTANQIAVKADTGFQLENGVNTDTYTVDLYDASGNKLSQSGGIADIGTLGSGKTGLDVWLNTKKEPVTRGEYKGTMNFYISFR